MINLELLSRKTTVDLTNEMTKEQPVILTYLLALDDMPFNQHEKELILYLGIEVWQMIKQSPKSLLKVTRKKLNRAEGATHT